MHSLGLSNIELRANLLSEKYPEELLRITVFEMKNILDRNPNLAAPTSLSDRQQQEFKDSLFWGSSSVTLDEHDRSQAWVESLAERVEPALELLEERPSVEDAFELLVVTGQLCREEVNSLYRDKAIEWHDRVRAVLARDEFRFTPDMIDQRLCQFTDLPIDAIAVAQPPSYVHHSRRETSPGLAEVARIPLQLADESIPQFSLQETSSPQIEHASEEKNRTNADPRLQRIVNSWPRLPEPFKASILALLDGVEQVSSH